MAHLVAVERDRLAGTSTVWGELVNRVSIRERPVSAVAPPSHEPSREPSHDRAAPFHVSADPLSVARNPDVLARWRDLERRALEPNPFLAPEAVLPAARHLGAPPSLRLLTAEQDGRTVFLLPVADAAPRTLSRVPRRVPLRRLGVAGLHTWMHSYCFLGTPLVDPDVDLDRLWEAVLTRLPASRRAPWLELPGIPVEGPIGASLHRVSAFRPARYTSQGSRSFVRRRPEPTYLSEWMSSKNRSNLGRKRRALQRELGVELVTGERGTTDPRAP